MQKISFFFLKRLLLVLMPLLCFVLMMQSSWTFFHSPPGKLALITLWMIVWWAFEVVPIPVTSLLPITFYPLMGILGDKEVSVQYSRPIIFLFMGGFFVAKALEKTGLHKRVALKVLMTVGGGYERTLLSFMITSFFLSMWISNTATTLLMICVAFGVLSFLEESQGEGDSLRGFQTALLLSIAYSSSVGGASTLIGTPPNGLLVAYLREHHSTDLSMLEWVKISFPFTLILLGLLWFWLTKICFKFPKKESDLSEYFANEKKKIGPLNSDEKIVLFVLFLTILFWLLRRSIASMSGLDLSDASIALVSALVLFSWPSKISRGYILDWKTAMEIPWGVLLMFGGALSMASAFKTTGLLDSFSELLVSLPEISPSFLLFAFSTVTLFLTELLTNSAAMANLLPILGVFAERYGLPVTYLAIPATLCCSLAFMLPVATPPNAIVFSSGKVRLKDMVLCGFGFNLIVLVAVFFYYRFFFSV